MVWEYQINEAYWQGHKGGRGLKLLKDLEKLSLAYTEEEKVSENTEKKREFGKLIKLKHDICAK